MVDFSIRLLPLILIVLILSATYTLEKTIVKTRNNTFVNLFTKTSLIDIMKTIDFLYHLPQKLQPKNHSLLVHSHLC